MQTNINRRLKFLGMLLFLLGLITGLALMSFTNPRMGLAAHLEGVMNGLFLIAAPLHLYKQLRYAYSLSRFSAIWRFCVLFFCIQMVLILFLQALLVLGAF